MKRINWRYLVPVSVAVAVLLTLLLPTPALAQGPSTTQTIIFAIIKVVLAAAMGVIGTELSKGVAWVQKLGVIAVGLAAVIYSWLVGFVLTHLGVALPADFSALTAQNVAALLSAIAALVLHINQVQTTKRLKRGLAW